MRLRALPKKPVLGEDWDPADVIAELRKAGWSLRKLSKHNGYNPDAAHVALKASWPRIERIIADALNIEPHDIWPSRYQDSVPHSRKGRKARAKPILERHNDEASNGL